MMPDLDTASPSQLRQYSNEMFAKSRQTQREVESYLRNFPVPTPSTPPPLARPIPIRSGEMDQSEMARARRRVIALQRIEAEEAKQAENEQRRQWRHSSPLCQLMR